MAFICLRRGRPIIHTQNPYKVDKQYEETKKPAQRAFPRFSLKQQRLSSIFLVLTLDITQWIQHSGFTTQLIPWKATQAIYLFYSILL